MNVEASAMVDAGVILERSKEVGIEWITVNSKIA
jgi:hypothetical protein